MPARRQLHQSSRRVDTGQLVNKFGSHGEQEAQRDARQRRGSDQHFAALLRVSPAQPLDFAGAGRRRSPAETARIVAERQQDRETMRRLRAYGLPAAIRPPVTMVDLATQGRRSEQRDDLPRWCVLGGHAAREQAEAHGLLAAYVEEHRPRRIVQLRLRPVGGPVPVHRLRAAHQDEGRRVGRAMEYIATWPGVTPIARATHHRPVDGGAMIDLHYHVAVQFDASDADERAEVFARLLRYCQRGGYDAWIADEADALLDPAATEKAESAQALAVYMREAAARYVKEFSDDYLAEYVRQVYHPSPLHRWQPLGPLRRLAAKLRADGVRPQAEDDGQVTLHPIVSARAQRRRDAAWIAAGPCVVALRVAWIGDELRPVAVVRGWRGDWAELARRYDLDAAVEAARAALAGASTFTTATPESPQSTTVARPPPPPVPPPQRPWIEAPELEEIPW